VALDAQIAGYGAGGKALVDCRYVRPAASDVSLPRTVVASDSLRGKFETSAPGSTSQDQSGQFERASPVATTRQSLLGK
jgi:hypothetical protein